MAIKLIVTDLDRTLLRNDGTVSENTARVFARAKNIGAKAVIATGRSLVEADYSKNMIGADEFMITYTGAKVVDIKNGGTVFERFIDEQTVRNMVEYSMQHFCDIFIVIYCDGRLMVPGRGLEIMEAKYPGNEFLASVRAQLIETDDPIKTIAEQKIKVNKLFCMNLNEEQLCELEDYIATLGCLDTMRTMPPGMDIIPKGVDKGSAVEALAAHLGLEKHEVMIVGDSGNDLAMYKEGFFKVAVENATPDIIEKADFITKSNNEDGVAYAVRRFVLMEDC